MNGQLTTVVLTSYASAPDKEGVLRRCPAVQDGSAIPVLGRVIVELRVANVEIAVHVSNEGASPKSKIKPDRCGAAKYGIVRFLVALRDVIVEFTVRNSRSNLREHVTADRKGSH